jgi:hypothetical protein
MLNDKMGAMLRRLLLATDFIKEVEVYENQPVDYDLDRFRAQSINLSQGNISRWYSNIINLPIDLTTPWLKAKPMPVSRLVVARSERYHSEYLDYSFLSEFNPMFIGIEKEFDIMAKVIKGLEYMPVDNFYHMAQIIAGSKMFVGNQSLPYAIAEGLKVPRVLEVCWYAGNVIPCGGNCIEAYTQRTFKKFVYDTIG